MYSRYHVGYCLSNAITTDWFVIAISYAILRYGSPKIINSDQRSQLAPKLYISFFKE